MRIAKTLAAALLCGALAVTSAAADDSYENFRALKLHNEMRQKAERESGYSSGGCDFGCQAFVGVIAVMMAERARRLRLQQQQWRAR